jgi:hypothetical protein
MIALCHKCSRSIFEFDFEFDAQVLTGCKDEPNIKCYEDTVSLCPLLKEVSDDS